MKTTFSFLLVILMTFFASCGKHEMDGVQPNGTVSVTTTYSTQPPLDGHMSAYSDPGMIGNVPYGSTAAITFTFWTQSGWQLGIFGYGQVGADRQNAVHQLYQQCVSMYMQEYNTTYPPPMYSFFVDLTYSADNNYIFAATGVVGYTMNARVKSNDPILQMQLQKCLEKVMEKLKTSIDPKDQKLYEMLKENPDKD